MKSVFNLIAYGGFAGFDVTFSLLAGDSLVQSARNTLVTQFLNTPEASHLMFIDADISFEPQHVHRLLTSGKEVCAGMYPLKTMQWDEHALFRATHGEHPHTATLVYVGTFCSRDEIERDGDFVTGVHCGSGFLMITRAAIERMIAGYAKLRYKGSNGEDHHALFEAMIDPETRTYLSEDYGFCRRWRDIGGKVWLDTAGKLTHIGPFGFDGDPHQRYKPTSAVWIHHFGTGR